MNKPTFTKTAFKALVDEASKILSPMLNDYLFWDIAGDYFLDKNQDYASAYFKTIAWHLQKKTPVLLYEISPRTGLAYPISKQSLLVKETSYKWGPAFNRLSKGLNPEDFDSLDYNQPKLRLDYYHTLGKMKIK